MAGKPYLKAWVALGNRPIFAGAAFLMEFSQLCAPPIGIDYKPNGIVGPDGFLFFSFQRALQERLGRRLAGIGVYFHLYLRGTTLEILKILCFAFGAFAVNQE
jgi:hypothetical protein